MNQLIKYSLLIISGLLIALGLGALPSKPSKDKEAPVVKAADQVSGNDQTSVEKAIELVKSGKNPMEGILMLKKIAEEDPTNIEALTQLAFFSIQSGQNQKAIERFKQIEVLDPEKTQALYFLGNLYLESGNKTEALTYFKKFKEVNTDDSLNEAIDQQIDLLTNKN